MWKKEICYRTVVQTVAEALVIFWFLVYLVKIFNFCFAKLFMFKSIYYAGLDTVKPKGRLEVLYIYNLMFELSKSDSVSGSTA